MGGGNNAGMRAAQRPLLRSCSTRTRGSSATRSSGSAPSPTRTRAPPSSGRGCATPTARSSARCAATRRCGGSRPSTSSSASSRRARGCLNAFYGGGFDHDAHARGRVAHGAALLVRREAADAVGLFDEDFFMFSEETDWLYRFRQAGWRCAFVPDAEVVHVGGASHGGRLYVENLRGHPALPREAPRPARGRARAAAPARGRCALRALVVPRRAAARATATGARFLASGDVRDAARGDRRVPAARRRDGASCSLPGWLVARALGQRGDRRRRSPGRFAAALRSPGRSSSPCTARSRSRSGCSPRSASPRSLAGLRRPPGARPPRPRRAAALVLRRRRRARAAALARRGRRHRRRALPPGARAQARRARRPAPAHGRRVQGRRPPPGLRVPALARLPRARREGLRASTRSSSSTTRPRCSCRSPASSRGRRASRSSARRRPGIAVLAGLSSRLYCFAAGHGGSYVSLALPATASRQLLVPAAIALFFTFVERRARRPIAAALAAAFGALALVHPTYALFALIPLGAYAIVRLAGVAALGGRARRGGRAGRARRPLAAAARRRDALATTRREPR